MILANCFDCYLSQRDARSALRQGFQEAVMRYGEFVSGITKAYQHAGGIKTLRLGELEQHWFRQIQSECSWIIENAGSSDVATPQHVTNWTRPTGQVRQFSLFNDTGNSSDTKGDYGYLGDSRKKHLTFPDLPGLSRFAGLFRPALRNLRLNGMGMKSALNAHEEGSIYVARIKRNYIMRFHLPVFTNEQAFVYLDGERFHYEERSLYFFNHGCVHAANNLGSEPRYHLVLDCFLDRDLFRRLFPGSPSRDRDFIKMDPAGTTQVGVEHHFPDFAQEGGHIMSGAIMYGRKVPSVLDRLRRDYPSIFRVTRRAGLSS